MPHIGNKVTKKGTIKNIESPEKLDELFQQYKEWVKQNPYLVHDFVGKDAIEVHKTKQRPITWSGFEGYLAENKIISQLTHYEQNTNGVYTAYLPIIARIKAEIHRDITDGSLTGVYNSNIGARLLGLKEQTDVTTGGEKISQNVIIDWSKNTPPTDKE